MHSLPRPSSVAPLVAALAAILVGCDTSTETSGGALVVGNPATEITVDFSVEDLSIGGSQDRLLLVDAWQDRVVIRDLSSPSEATLGKRGGGPCEFRGIISTAALDDSTLILIGSPPGALRVCRTSGAELPSIAFQGRLVQLEGGGPAPVLALLESDSDSLSVLSLSMEPIGVLRVDTISSVSGAGLRSMLGGSKYRSANALGRTGVLYAGTDDTTFALASAVSGQLTKFARPVLAPVQESAAELAARDRAMRRVMASRGVPLPPAKTVTDQSPSWKAAFKWRSLAVDDSGNLWMLPAYRDSTPAIVMVYDASGRELARLPLPRPIVKFRLAFGRLYGFWNDEDDNGHVAVWTIADSAGRITLR